jgi:uncharacterized membrane protein (UPF0127 family)
MRALPRRDGVRAGAAALLAVVPLVSCSASDAPASDSPAATATVAIVGGPSFGIEVADTAPAREQGLSGRAALAADNGMLFVYDDAQPRRYWMADMLFAIDLAWIREGRILAVETLRPCPSRDQCPGHASPGPVDTVLEVPAGSLAGIPSGTQVMIG